MHQDEGLQGDFEPSCPDSPPEDVEFRIRNDFDEIAPPLPLLCPNDNYKSDNGKVRLYN